jgi:hypothetical protein
LGRRLSDHSAALKHRYRDRDGKRLTGVTSVTKLVDVDDKSIRFAYAAARLTREGKDFKKVWDLKRDLGTEVHTCLEKWMRGETIEATEDERFTMDDVSPYLDALEIAIGMYQIEMVAQECIVITEPVMDEDGNLVHPGYGGRFDLLCWITDPVTGHRELWLLDLKTGRESQVPHALQLNAYAFAEGIAQFNEEGERFGLSNTWLRRIDRLGALYVEPSGARLAEVPLDEEIHAMFLTMLNLRTDYKVLQKRLGEESNE